VSGGSCWTKLLNNRIKKRTDSFTCSSAKCMFRTTTKICNVLYL